HRARARENAVALRRASRRGRVPRFAAARTFRRTIRYASSPMRASLFVLLLAAPACTTPAPSAITIDASAASLAIAPSASTPASPEPISEPVDANVEGWCTEGLEALDAETCVVVPADLA